MVTKSCDKRSGQGDVPQNYTQGPIHSPLGLNTNRGASPARPSPLQVVRNILCVWHLHLLPLLSSYFFLTRPCLGAGGPKAGRAEQWRSTPVPLPPRQPQNNLQGRAQTCKAAALLFSPVAPNRQNKNHAKCEPNGSAATRVN